jgi:HEAT repeat protein
VRLTESEILNRLRSGRESLEQQAKLLTELQYVGTAASVPVLRSNVEAADVRVRVAALRALVVVSGVKALDCFLAALMHDDSTTAKWAALFVARVGDSEVVPDLIAAANERWDEPDSPRAAIVKALGPFRDVRAVPVFRKGVTEQERALRKQSAFGLALLGTPGSQEMLDDALRQLSWSRARAVRRAIRVARRTNSRNRGHGQG